MIGAYAWDEVELPSRILVEEIRTNTDRITDQIVLRIQSEEPAYAGPVEGKRHWLIGTATRAALAQLASVLEGGAPTSRKLDDLYAKMGYGEAMDGHDLAMIISTLNRAVVMIWDEVRALAVAREASAAALSHVSDALQEQIRHLREQVRTGYREAQRVLAAASARSRTLDALLTRSQNGLVEVARSASWEIPARVVVVTAIRTPGSEPFTLAVPNALHSEGNPVSIAIAADELEPVLELLAEDESITQAAASWPVAAVDAVDGHRWTRRALDLARRGVLPDPSKILRCVDYRTQLWLHAEPTLRRQLCQELLPPLLAETPNSREILSETLLAWLETRDSAPAIAARLDVHPQTVRYRWKRINELFGEALHDPEAVLQLTLLLKASVPMWKAGDQSDFERFQADR